MPRSHTDLRRTLADMATTKKIKLSDEAVAENDSGVFQALDQVQQKLDQVRRNGVLRALLFQQRMRENIIAERRMTLVVCADHRSEK